MYQERPPLLAQNTDLTREVAELTKQVHAAICPGGNTTAAP